MVFPEIYSATGMMELIQKIGFLPLLYSGIEGFSAEDIVDEDCRYVTFPEGGWDWPLWKWKGEILTWDDPNRNTRAESDRYLENGSYLRLRSVQLGYTFPQTWFKGAIQHARVYINAENLFTITSYSGYSPDVNADNANYRGFDNFIYPTNRTFMLGLNVTF